MAQAAGKAEAKAIPAPCVIHIGYPRTGTSFLQTRVLSGLDGYLAPAPELEDSLKRLQHVIADRAVSPAGAFRTPVVLSEESIASTIDGDTPQNAARLHAVCPESRVVIVIRSQFSIFRSFYHLYVKSGGTMSYPDFVDERSERLFRYRETMASYRALFGAENVLALLYEDLLARPDHFLGELLDFMGCDRSVVTDVGRTRVKASAGDLTMRVLRWRNIFVLKPIARYCPRFLAPVQRKGLPGFRQIDRFLHRVGLGALPLEKALETIREAYADDNAALFDMIGKDITAYDYPQPGRP